MTGFACEITVANAELALAALVSASPVLGPICLWRIQRLLSSDESHLVRKPPTPQPARRYFCEACRKGLSSLESIQIIDPFRTPANAPLGPGAPGHCPDCAAPVLDLSHWQARERWARLESDHDHPRRRGNALRFTGLVIVAAGLACAGLTRLSQGTGATNGLAIIAGLVLFVAFTPRRLRPLWWSRPQPLLAWTRAEAASIPKSGVQPEGPSAARQQGL